jgi:DNA-binding transcriptional ArsR family regulator
MPQRIPARIELKPAQRVALDALGDDRVAELTRSAYEQLTGMSRSQAAYDLAELVEAGLLERIGGGRSTRYRLARNGDPTQRQWTDERIGAELVRFCAGRKTWPSAREFKNGGRTDLYVAASRYGGIAYWAAELGLPRGGGDATARRALTPLRRLGWGVCGAAAGAAVVAVSLAVVRDRPPRAPAVAAGPVARAAKPARPATAQRMRATRGRSRERAASRAVRSDGQRRGTAVISTRHVSPAPPASQPASQPVRVSPPAATREPAHVVLASTPPPGPTPIAAPASSGSAPPPLPAP